MSVDIEISSDVCKVRLNRNTLSVGDSSKRLWRAYHGNENQCMTFGLCFDFWFDTNLSIVRVCLNSFSISNAQSMVPYVGSGSIEYLEDVQMLRRTQFRSRTFWIHVQVYRSSEADLQRPMTSRAAPSAYSFIAHRILAERTIAKVL